jgi:hypothetical protein
MGFLSFIIIVAVIILILRLLRSVYEWMDNFLLISFWIVLIASVVLWIRDGFWSALIFFIVGEFLLGLIYGSGEPTKIERNGKVYKFKCTKCGYEKLDIIEEEESEENEEGVPIVTLKCKRCGEEQPYKLL